MRRLIPVLAAAVLLAACGGDDDASPEVESPELAELHAGFSRAHFRDVLGSPVFDRRSPDRELREQTFQGPEHWVQTISARDGTVLLYSVTACGNFKPRFEFPAVDAGGGRSTAVVTLNETSFDDVVDERRGKVFVSYAARGARANSKFYDVYAGTSTGNFKTFIWGLNEVCPGWPEYYKGLRDRGVLPNEAGGFTGGRLKDAPEWAGRLRREIVNTYAESAPGIEIGEIRRAFDIGADRALTRTAE
jgi:hypothetical protein